MVFAWLCRSRPLVWLVGLGLLGVHMGAGHGSIDSRAVDPVENSRDGWQSEVRKAEPTARLVRAWERWDERASSARLAARGEPDFSPRHIAVRTVRLPPVEPPPEVRAAEFRVVAAPMLNMRAGAGVAAERLAAYPEGTSLRLVEVEGAWARMEDPQTGRTGWMALRHLKEPAAASAAVGADRAASRG